MATAFLKSIFERLNVIGMLSSKAHELQAVSAPQIHASTPGLLHGKLAEDPGVNLGVALPGQNFSSGVTNDKFPFSNGTTSPCT